MEVMRLEMIQKWSVDPAQSQTRAAGVLLMPHMERAVKRDAKLLTGHET
jgi:hypothetical protein